ncbi:shufflon protein C (plasmid) [Escherichia coli]|nr:shufflon protein C [Escherichia coli]
MVQPPCQSGSWTIAPTLNVSRYTEYVQIGKCTWQYLVLVRISSAYCAWTYLNGSPFGGFQQVYSDSNNNWYVNNYAWDNYASGGTISVTCLNLPNAGV